MCVTFQDSLRPPKRTLRMISSMPAPPKQHRGRRRRARDGGCLRSRLVLLVFSAGRRVTCCVIHDNLRSNKPLPDRGPNPVFFFGIKTNGVLSVPVSDGPYTVATTTEHEGASGRILMLCPPPPRLHRSELPITRGQSQFLIAKISMFP